jgi:hypothetical protein
MIFILKYAIYGNMIEQKNTGTSIHYTALPSHNLFACQPPDVLYHYTDYEGANGIITSKSLWMTKIQYLNDITELNYGIRFFRQITRSIGESIGDPELRIFLESVSEQLEAFSSTNICVASFCDGDDILSQWRAYGNLGNGVALGFSGNSLNNLNGTGLNLWKCVYDPDEQHKIMEELVNILIKAYNTISKNKNKVPDWKNNLTAHFNTTFLRIAPVMKDTHFHEEKEWRLVTKSIPFTDINYHARITNNRVSQYYSIDFCLLNSGKFDFLEYIVIGPTRDQRLISSAFKVLLDEYGYKYKVGKDSPIPFRSP